MTVPGLQEEPAEKPAEIGPAAPGVGRGPERV